MAKILQVTSQTQKLPGSTRHTYPPEYDSTKINILCHELPSEITARNNNDCYWIGVVSDADAPGFLLSPDIIELSRANAITKGRVWREQINKIMDDDEVVRIIVKKMKGGTLTQKEINALDPDNSEKGINKSRLFDDLLDEYT